MSNESEAGGDEVPGQREFRHEGYDIGAVIRNVLRDELWWKKVLVIGLWGLIPIAGWLNALGWTKAVYQARAHDEHDLPAAGFSYLADGFAVFLAFLPLGAVFLVVQVILGLLSDIRVIGTLFGLVSFVLALAFAAIMPAIFYVHVKDGDSMASLRFQRLRSIVQDNASAYLLLLVTCFGLGVLAHIGALFFCVGALCTAPLASTLLGSALAEFDHEVKG